MPLIRLTEINPKWVDARHDEYDYKVVILNTDVIAVAEGVRRGVGSVVGGPRFCLKITLKGEDEPRLFAAIDLDGKNTLLERSEDEVITNFKSYIDTL